MNEEEDAVNDCIFLEARMKKFEGPSQNQSFISNGRAFQSIVQKLKEINDALGKLQTLGIQHVASLPELVLVGDQSAGKSSLMSALAGLNLPQSHGTCTRCPVHIRLSRATEWCCRISLQIDYAYSPGSERITKRDVTSGKPFPPWVRQTRVVKDFKTVREKMDSVEEVLRWAQLAILNPGQSHELYVPRDPGEADDESKVSPHDVSTEAKFSPNVVALEITGPDLPDLSFYDLPGVFSISEKAEDDYLVRVVENLARGYIQRPGAIVLWAVPMNADPETSCSFRLIREAKAENRVLGVITKADLLPKGNVNRWISMLNGNAHKTGLGYFVTSRPDKNELEDQEAFEEAFFNRVLTEPNEEPEWPLEFQDFDDVCGVTKLKDFLSQKLAAAFAKSLPEVKSKVETRRAEIEARLKELPELPHNPELEVRQGLGKFTELVKVALNTQGFTNAWKENQDAFTGAILRIKPIYRVLPPIITVINLTDDDSVGPDSPGPQAQSSAPRPKRRAEGVDSQTPSKRRPGNTHGVKAEDSTPSFAFSTLPVGGDVTPVLAPRELRPNGQLPSRPLMEVRALINAHRQHGIPDDVPVGVKSFLCLEAIRHWDKPLAKFVNDSMDLIQLEVNRCLGTAFTALRQRAVFKESSAHVRTFLNYHREAIKSQVTNLHHLESYQLYSINTDIFKKNLEDERRLLARHRHHYRWAQRTGTEPDVSSLKDWATLTQEERGQEELKMQKEAAKLGKDDMELELELCAWVRGYYLTSAMRFIENVSLHFNSGLFPKIQKTVNNHIDEKLGLMGSPDASLFDHLMAEDGHIAEARERLKRDHAKFCSALETIRELENSTGANEMDEMVLDDGVGGIDHPVDLPTPASSSSENPHPHGSYERAYNIGQI